MNIETILADAKMKERELAQTPIDTILDVLHLLGQNWREGTAYYNEALEKLPAEISFSKEMIEETLKIIPALLDRENLVKRLNAELGDYKILDRFSRVEGFEGKLRAFPLGTLLHVSAGNVFLGCIDSLLMGLLTKNISILKLSSQNQIFPELFARSFRESDKEQILSNKFSILHWKGGDERFEVPLKKQVKAILAWGGDEMLQSYSQGLGRGVKLLDFGPKISLQVLSKRAFQACSLEQASQAIARDVCLWDQQACASSQNLFIEEGVDVQKLMKALSLAFDSFSLTRGELDSDEEVEILKEDFRARYSETMEGGGLLRGKNYLLHYETKPFLRPSPLNRTLIIKTYKNLEDLCSQLEPFSFYLQSCGYALASDEKELYLGELGRIGMKRFAPVGQVMDGLIGAPHDGRHVLRDLVSLVGDEKKESLSDFLQETAAEVPYYEKALKGQDACQLENFPFCDATLLSEHPLFESRAFIKKELEAGYVFSSGGTSGKSKYAFYSDKEFTEVAKMLAQGFKAQGLKEGQIVANLFAAGNLWSSFLAVDRALSLCQAVQLPIGALGEVETIVSYLKRFKPHAVFGLPSMLVGYANFCKAQKIDIEVPQVFYAGEHLSQGAREFLGQVWKTKKFSSAGYASVDAGPIGYQCAHCSPGEHHLFSKHIYLEVLNEEAVVTSLFRKTMPIIRYKTGDRILPLTEPCRCGSADQKFLLQGRLDGQINIWSCRLLVSDIEKSFSDLKLTVPLYQIRLKTERKGESLNEKLVLLLENITLTDSLKDELKKTLYNNARDVKATHSFDFVQSLIELEVVRENTIERVARTGKIKLIVDER